MPKQMLESFTDDSPPQIDYIMNQPGSDAMAGGDVATKLIRNGGDVSILRPYLGDDDRSYITKNDGQGNSHAMVLNAPIATLRWRDWILMDEAVVRAAKPRLRIVADLRGMGLQYTIPNGMGKTVLEYQTQSDISAAIVSMDGVRRSQRDRPQFGLGFLPLPIIHKDFSFSAREVMQSQNNGHMPIDTTAAELAARRVAEMAEQLTAGTVTGTTFGGGTVYGLTNFPSRLTYSITLPTATGWIPTQTVTDVLNMILTSQQHFHYGPWLLYHSTDWTPFMDGDYSAAKGDATLRERLRMIDNIIDVRVSDYLPSGYSLVLVQASTDVIRMVVGMDIMTIQWATEGGMELHFKVMCIITPHLRADYNGNTGIVSSV